MEVIASGGPLLPGLSACKLRSTSDPQNWGRNGRPPASASHKQSTSIVKTPGTALRWSELRNAAFCQRCRQQHDMSVLVPQGRYWSSPPCLPFTKRPKRTRVVASLGSEGERQVEQPGLSGQHEDQGGVDIAAGSDAVGGPRVIHPRIGQPLRDATTNGSPKQIDVEGAAGEAGSGPSRTHDAVGAGSEEDDPGAMTASIVNEIRQLALPALGSCLADPLMSLIDSCCVGQIGSVQLASLGPNTAIFNFVFQVFGFLGVSTTSMLASLSSGGTGDPAAAQRKAARTLSVALSLAVVLGVVALAGLEFQGATLLRAMGASAELMGPGLAYLRIRALSAPAVMVLIVGQGACLGCQDARTPLVIFLGAGLLNVVGDILLTLHLRWGVRGAAWATVGAQYVGAAVFLVALAASSLSSVSGGAPRGRRRRVAPPFAVQWGAWPTQGEARALVAVGGTLVLRSLCGMLVYTMLASAATSLGTLHIAAHQVSMQLFWFLSYFPEPLSISAQSLVARDMAQEPKGVLAVSLQNALSSWLCALAVVLDGVAIGSGDYGYMPRMQFFNMVGVGCALQVSGRAGWGLPGVWHCLTLFFVLRIVYHAVHIATNRTTHVLGW